MPVNFAQKRNEFVQDPDDVLDYKIDWSEVLPEGDTIIQSTWKDESEDLTLSDETFNTTATAVWVTGGDPNYKYKIRNEIRTAEGRKFTSSIFIVMKSR